MSVSFCSSKGGVGTSVIAATFASELSRASAKHVVLVDYCGSQGDMFGVETEGALGVVDWLLSGSDVGADALDNLLIDIAPGLALLPRGTQPLPVSSGNIKPERYAQLVEGFSSWSVVGDIGVVDTDVLSPRVMLLAGGGQSVMVTRACYLALRQLPKLPVVIQGVVEVVEAGRSLGTLDIESVSGVPVLARVRADPTVARAVDAGILRSRTPRSLRRMARHLREALELTNTPLELAAVRR